MRPRIPKGMKIAISISIAFSFDFLIRNENIIPEEHKTKSRLTLFDMGGGHDAPPPKKNVFEHCAQTLRRRKLKLGDFSY